MSCFSFPLLFYSSFFLKHLKGFLLLQNCVRSKTVFCVAFCLFQHKVTSPNIDLIHKTFAYPSFLWEFLVLDSLNPYYCQFIESLLCRLCNKFQPLEFLISVKIYHWVYYSAQFIIDWEAKQQKFISQSWRDRCLKDQGALVLIADGCPFAVLTHCRDRKLRCLFLFLRRHSIHPIMGASPSWPHLNLITSQRPPTLIPSFCRFNIWIWEGTQHSAHDILPQASHNSCPYCMSVHPSIPRTLNLL